MAPSLKLWYSPGACSMAVHIVLRQSKLPFETVRVSVREGAPEHLRQVNPKMKVPVLIMDGKETITEIPAIMTAISQLVPDQKLLGKSDLEVVRTYEWMNYLSGYLHSRGFGMLFRPARFIEDASFHDKIKARGLEVIQEAYDYIEERLNGIHAVGDSFTVIDAYMFVFYSWGATATSIDMAKYPKYSKLVSELSKEPALRETIDEEGLPFYDPTMPQKS